MLNYVIIGWCIGIETMILVSIYKKAWEVIKI